MQATELDHSDALRAFRERFHLPRTNGREQAYFCGNSLGLMPRSARDQVEEVLQQWSAEGVEAHFKGHSQWMPYHELVRDDLAAVVGALPLEVVAMNSLTANLHLMMASFYRPAGSRRRILIEARAFPSDRHAVASQIRWHGGDPATDLIELAPEPGQDLLDALEDSRYAPCIVFPEGEGPNPAAQFYVSQLKPYYRAPHLYIGFPARYRGGGRRDR